MPAFHVFDLDVTQRVFAVCGTATRVLALHEQLGLPGGRASEPLYQVVESPHGTVIPEHARIGFGIWTMLPIRDGRSRSLEGQGLSTRWQRFRARGVG